jgi:hypothetical protein
LVLCAFAGSIPILKALFDNADSATPTLPRIGSRHRYAESHQRPCAQRLPGFRLDAAGGTRRLSAFAADQRVVFAPGVPSVDFGAFSGSATAENLDN